MGILHALKLVKAKRNSYNLFGIDYVGILHVLKVVRAKRNCCQGERKLFQLITCKSLLRDRAYVGLCLKRKTILLYVHRSEAAY